MAVTAGAATSMRIWVFTLHLHWKRIDTPQWIEHKSREKKTTLAWMAWMAIIGRTWIFLRRGGEGKGWEGGLLEHLEACTYNKIFELAVSNAVSCPVSCTVSCRVSCRVPCGVSCGVSCGVFVEFVNLSEFSFQPILILKKDILVCNVLLKVYGLAIWEWLFGMGTFFAKLLQEHSWYDKYTCAPAKALQKLSPSRKTTFHLWRNVMTLIFGRYYIPWKNYNCLADFLTCFEIQG